MKNKIILIVCIVILIFVNWQSACIKISPTNSKINEIIKDSLPEDSKPILIIMQDFFVSNPRMEIIYINNMKISTLRTSSGSQSNPKYKIISEVIENDIFNYLWIVNIILLIIIIFNIVIIKRRNKKLEEETYNKLLK